MTQIETLISDGSSEALVEKFPPPGKFALWLMQAVWETDVLKQREIIKWSDVFEWVGKKS